MEGVVAILFERRMRMRINRQFIRDHMDPFNIPEQR